MSLMNSVNYLLGLKQGHSEARS